MLVADNSSALGPPSLGGGVPVDPLAASAAGVCAEIPPRVGIRE